MVLLVDLHLRLVKDGKVRFRVENEVVPPEDLEGTFNYIVFFRTLKR